MNATTNLGQFCPLLSPSVGAEEVVESRGVEPLTGGGETTADSDASSASATADPPKQPPGIGLPRIGTTALQALRAAAELDGLERTSGCWIPKGARRGRGTLSWAGLCINTLLSKGVLEVRRVGPDGRPTHVAINDLGHRVLGAAAARKGRNSRRGGRR